MICPMCSTFGFARYRLPWLRQERGFQFDTPVNARYSTSMLLYFCNRPESLRWVCYVCRKGIIKGVRFCCHTHAKSM